MNTHIHYPYPTEREKECMMYDTGIDRRRLDVWLRNNRNRYVKKVKQRQQHQQCQQHQRGRTATSTTSSPVLIEPKNGKRKV